MSLRFVGWGSYHAPVLHGAETETCSLLLTDSQHCSQVNWPLLWFTLTSAHGGYPRFSALSTRCHLAHKEHTASSLAGALFSGLVAVLRCIKAKMK